MPSVQSLKIIGIFLTVISVFISGCVFQSSRDTVKLNKAVEAQKTSDAIACNNAKQTGANIGDELQSNINHADSDYDNWVRNNATYAGSSVSPVSGNGSTGRVVLPTGARLVNTIKYGQILRDADKQRGQLISLQACVKAPQGCHYP